MPPESASALALQGFSRTRGDDRGLAELATRQHGVVGRRQLVRLGLSEEAIEVRIRAGRLQRLQPGVYAVGHRAIKREGRWLAAILASGPGAVLSHLSAPAPAGSCQEPVGGAVSGAPAPTRPAAASSQRLDRGGQKRFQVDCHWPGTGQVVELDGWEAHGTRSAFGDDRARDRILRTAGYAVTRISWAQLDGQPEAVASDLRKLLSYSQYKCM